MKKKSQKTLLQKWAAFLQVYRIYLTSSLKNKLISLALLTLVVMLLCITGVWRIDYQLFLNRQENNIHRINSSLEHIIKIRFTSPAETLAGSTTIIRLLRKELSDADQEVRLTLDTARSLTGANLVYILDRHGYMIASAQHPLKKEIMLKAYQFRPYFQAGMSGQTVLYAAVGVYTKERGAYLAAPVVERNGGKPIGVVVFRSGLDEVDKLFSTLQDTVMLISPDGVIFSTNREEWLFRTCSKLDRETIARIYQEKQFPEHFELAPLPVNIIGGTESVDLDGHHYAVHSEDAVIPGWKLVSLSRYEFPLSWVVVSGVVVLLLSIIATLYLASLEKKRTLQFSYDIQSLDLNRTRKELVRSEALLSSVVEDQNEMICRFDADHRINFVNGAFCRYFGKNREELVGTVFVPPYASGELEVVKQHFNGLTVDNPVCEIEYRIEMPVHNFRWHAATIRKVFDDEGKFTEYQAVMRDVSARKQGEEALMEANEELSQYAYAVSHDLKAPLRAIHNYSDFLREDLAGTLEGEQKLYLDRLDKAVREAEVMIEDLLALSRVSHCSITMARIEMGPFLRSLLAILELPKEVKVLQASDWPVLEAEPMLLKQVFLNLIANAAKYNSAPEKLIELGWYPDEEGNYVIYVRDNGIGIDKRYHEQIFRVFERLHTRDEYEGTGAGLAIVRKAVSRLRGSIRVDSAPGAGSTFYVTLPANQKEKTV